MTITHHPAPESLMSCSAGSMPEAFAAVMASHLSMCPTCRHELAIFQDVGTALFDLLPPIAVAHHAPLLAMRGLESETGVADRTEARGDVPQPLVTAVGPWLDRLAWSRIAPSVWQHEIVLSNSKRGTLRLLKIAPGSALPAHDHEGSELTLVLRGSFCDSTGEYRPGDVADLSAGVEHAPVADPQLGCICLVAKQGTLKFKSRLAGLVQPLVGL